MEVEEGDSERESIREVDSWMMVVVLVTLYTFDHLLAGGLVGVAFTMDGVGRL